MARRLLADLDWNHSGCVSPLSRTANQTLTASSHDRAFLDHVATDIIHQHSQRLDYYKGNFSNFYATKIERARTQKKEYETQLAYRQHLQAYIDRWRYNANRGESLISASDHADELSASGSK